jgi:hypothetical protein
MTDTLTLHMTVEVMGCPTVCQHCWAMGRGYQAMPLSDISWVLHEVRRFCEAHGFAYGGFPMHEVDAHPQVVQVLHLFTEIWHDDFQPFTTTGVPLATRPDWREILETLRELNAPTLWFAFHGTDEIHDRAVMRQGAYHESLRAVEFTREVEGMKSGCNLFLTTENIHQFDQLVADLQHAGMQEIIPCIYSFTPNARGRHTEPLRPEWRDVEPLIEKLDAIPQACLWRHILPGMHTESWYVQQALAGTWPDDMERYEQAYRNLVSLVCRPNLDVCRGFAGQYTTRYGNLRRDGVDEVLSRAMADGQSSYDEIWFAGEQVLPIQELAMRFGDVQSQRIHDNAFSIRDWWIDCCRRARHGVRLHS